MTNIAENLATKIAESFSGEEREEEIYEEAELEDEIPKERYKFEAKFQDKIMALVISDTVFAKKTFGLILPDYFENAATATLVNIAQQHYKKYGQAPSAVSLGQLIKKEGLAGRIRKDLFREVVEKFKAATTKGGALSNLSDREFVVDQVAEFASHQAYTRAVIKSTDLIQKGKFDEVSKLMADAAKVGKSGTENSYDYFANIEQRSAVRRDKAAGILPPQGITTGVKKLDELLYHKGWGLRELSMLMGGMKAGKSTGLLFFAKNAALAGHNTLYVTLEMSAEIASEREDASISTIEMKELGHHINEVEEKVREAHKKAGLLYMDEFPTGTLTPSALRRLLDAHAAEGRRFKFLVVDYLDLMAPDYRTDSTTENSKQIYAAVRAIAQEEHIAILSATQTNREGYKSITAKGEHISDDINKGRIADLLITINITEEERDRGEMRLFFALSRNQAAGMMLQVKQDLERAIFIKSVIGLI